MINSKICLLVILFSSSIAYSQEVYHWRGQNRDGIYHEQNLLKKWPEEGPKVLWVNENIGEGYGAATVANNMILVNGKIDSLSYTFALDLNGKLLWKAPNGSAFVGNGFSANFPGSRSTPTVVSDLIYVLSGNGRISCLEKETGKEKWSVDMVGNFKGFMDQHGYSESLLVDDDKVYCFPGGSEINIVALNRYTGTTVWASKAMADTVSYCSPMMIETKDRNILVTFSGHYLMGLDAENGKLLWSHSQAYHRYHQHCNTPVYQDGHIYYISGEGNGAVKLKLSADGNSISEIWRNSSIKNVFGGFVLLNDHLFSPESTKLKCLDDSTGEVIDSVNVKKGSLVFSDGMLYCYSDNGYVNLIKLEGTKMEVVSKFKCDKGTKEHFAHPVISNGVLYIRHGKALIAYDIKGN